MDASKPLFFLVLLLTNGIWYLPLIMLVAPGWRRIMDKFLHGDDNKYEKSDRKDAGIDIVAFYLFAFAVHITSYDMIYKEDHFQYVLSFIGTSLTLWGFKELALKRSEPKSTQP